MNVYNLNQLGWHNFQQLCLTISREVLGQTIQVFLDSKDGGRDGAFAGNWRPRGGEDLRGRFVIQCKFTSKTDQSLKLSDIADELSKAERLVKEGRCDCYLLLTNFGLSGIGDEKIEDTFLTAGVKQFRCFGSDWISQQIRDNSRLRMLVPRVYGLGDLSQILDERAYNQARAVLDSMREDLSRVVLTRVYDKAVRALEDEGFVLLLGEPACGKTTIAAMLAMASIDQWKVSTLKLETSQQMVERWNPHEPQQFFWIDDAFGVTQYELPLTLDWNRIFPKVRTMIKAGARIVLTSRDYIYRRAKQDLKELAFPLMRESQVVVNVHDISEGERRQILYNHIKLGNQSTSFRREIKPFLEEVASHRRFSPEIARRLGNSRFTVSLRISQSALADFVERQGQLLQDVISGLDKHSRAALALIFMRNDALESPVKIRDSEDSAINRLGSNLGETITALGALQDSLTVHVKEASQAFWRFRHPTVGDAYGIIVLHNPELMDIYIEGAPTEKLLTAITCGNVELEGAVVVPQGLYEAVITRLISFLDMNSFQTSGDLRQRRSRIYRFLAGRCDRTFLTVFLERHSEVLERVSRPGQSLSVAPEVELGVRLFEFGLLPEQYRKKFVETVTQYTVDGEDSYVFQNERIRRIFTPEENQGLVCRLRTELIPNLATVRHHWQSNHDGDEDPESCMEPFFEIVAALEEEFDSDESIGAAIERERNRALRWVEETNSEMEEALNRMSEEFEEPEYLPSSDKLAPERSIFDDIDL